MLYPDEIHGGVDPSKPIPIPSYSHAISSSNV